jgi:prepilin-type N-terminal cleavage/methylation domain-containing protein
MRSAGFTLVELLTVVTILGVLAAVAIPAFIQYTLHARAAEAPQQLRTMFAAAASFYTAERTFKGMQGSQVTYCVVDSVPMNPTAPSVSKQPFVASGSLAEPLHFAISDYVYFGYSLVSSAASPVECSTPPSTPALYTMVANGDLDGDSILSTYEMAVGSDSSNTLFHTRGFYISSPIE